jgi:hypothetical protein
MFYWFRYPGRAEIFRFAEPAHRAEDAQWGGRGLDRLHNCCPLG